MIPDADVTKWAVQIGGPLFLALVLVLFFYRRDFQQALTHARQQNTALVDLTKIVVTALQENKAATERLTDAIERIEDMQR